MILSSYVSNRKKNVKINNSFSSWTDMIQSVPQGLALGFLLFNIYLSDLFFTLKNIDVCNFADNAAPYVCTKLSLCWFEDNYMRLNTDKCHLMVSVYKHEQVWAQIGGDNIWESADVKLLGVHYR